MGLWGRNSCGRTTHHILHLNPQVLFGLAILCLLGCQAVFSARADSQSLSFRSRVAGASGIMTLKHKYAEREGSSYRSGGKHMTWDHYHLLRKHDLSRQRRFLSDVVKFPLGGNPDPDADGLYFTKVTLGTPPQDFYLQIDTGSDLMWVYCVPCSGCPTGASGLGFNPGQSATSAGVGCSDQICNKLLDSSAQKCVDALCEYTLIYGDQSSSSGYIVSDVLTYTELNANSSTVNATARVSFGCGNSQTGDLNSPSRSVDGIIGFGQNAVSISSQLFNLGKTPNTFAHCLEGEGKGGGIMVLGRVEDPDLVYTPIVPKQTHYNVYLEKIAVAGSNLSIDPSTFAATGNGGTGTIFDSGTTLTILSSGAFSTVVSAIQSNIRRGVGTAKVEGFDCYILPSGSKVENYLPSMTLYFRNATMQLKPQNYVFQIQSTSGEVWCFGWMQSSQDLPLTIIGDIVMKDRLVVYDNVNHLIGWADYDCTSALQVARDQGAPVAVNPSPSLTVPSGVVQHGAGDFGMIILFMTLGWGLALL